MMYEYLYNDINASTANWQFGRQMIYDSSNRMKYLSDWRYDEDRQTHYTGKLIQYKYDHQGKRIRKWGTYGCNLDDGCTGGNTVMTVQKFYHGDYYETYGKGLITYKHISDGNDIVATVVDLGDTVCDTCGPSNYYYTQNHIGSTIQFSGDQGNPTEHFIYTPFGQIAYHWMNEDDMPIGFYSSILFTGQQLDGDTGQYYFKARYYDPAIGIFTRPDPALDGLNHYVYANANPIRYIDPSGLETQEMLIAPKTEKSPEETLVDTVIEHHKEANKADTIKTTAEMKQLMKSGLSEIDAKNKLLLSGDMMRFIYKNEDGTYSSLKVSIFLTGGINNISKEALKRAIGATGKIGEQQLAKSLKGGVAHKYFSSKLTKAGGRYVDRYFKNFAHESKVGYTSASKFVRQQVLKDSALIKGGHIEGATWHFYRSPATGKHGASKPLLDLLEKHGINT